MRYFLLLSLRCRYVFEKLFMNEKPSAGWNLDDGYTQSTTTDTYPHRALLPGSSHALVVYTRSYNNEDEYLCSSFIKGFKVSVRKIINTFHNN